MAAFMMIVMMGLLALSVDLGYITTVSSELKRATDSAALAGAGALIEGPEAAELEAFKFLARNPVGGTLIAEREGWEESAEQWIADHPDEFRVEMGHWYPDNPRPEPGEEDDLRFVPSDQYPSTIRVRTLHKNAPLFFAKALGYNDFSVRAESIARYQPRDIVLVLDFSASMNDDSELRRIQEYGEDARAAVEDSLARIDHELNPSYGTLQFEPRYLTLDGVPPSVPSMPRITVTFRSNDVYVESTKDISNIVLEFSDGTTERFEGMEDGILSGAYRGTGYNYSKRIDAVWVKSGTNANLVDGRGYGEKFEDNYDTIKHAFGLDAVPYPYASGSWNDYIYYVKTSGYVNTAAYRKMYGYMTLINYWLEKKPEYDQTCDLWQVSAQPVAAVKDASGVFMTYIQEVDCDDRVALVVYNSPSQNALVEHTLTEDFASIDDTIQHRQAGHYDRFTNIGAGIREAWMELDNNARGNSLKMIVLMTDGQANRPGSTTEGKNYAIEQAGIAAGKDYPIVTISLGNGADTNLMQQIADATEGVHFNVPGGETVTDYETDLLGVFRQIADDRPLVLVK